MKAYAAGGDIENLAHPEPAEETGIKPTPKTSAAKLKGDSALMNQLRNAVEAALWAHPTDYAPCHVLAWRTWQPSATDRCTIRIGAPIWPCYRLRYFGR